MPAHRLVGAAGAVSAVISGRASVFVPKFNKEFTPLCIHTRLFGNFFVEIREEVPVAVAVRWHRDR